ncbi:MAG: redoxin domain-containing protein [Firmicutes bacterium]|nr:redoxin domain-containing protein [Bacillota bacterium]
MARIKAGDKFPNFEFKTAYKVGLHVYDVLKGKTIFWVLRYIGCTSCNFDVAMIAADYDKFTAKNAQVFVVMQSDQEHLKTDLEKRPIPFEIISDDKMEIYKALEILPAKDKEGLMNGPEYMAKFMKKREKIQEMGLTHGDYEGDELQLPAFFIVEEDGTVSYAHYAESIADMPEVDEAVAML